ncbi:MAG: cardiolipin synthase [Synergistaceae bacterium]|jgi:cardiolipin synthase|nr:cardiolipin synthase [Synergistaceae bacterium]
MTYGKPLLKKFLLIAAAAFAAGLVPYFWRVIFTEPHEMTAARYIYGSLISLAEVLSGFIPHIVTVYVIFIAVLVFLEERNPDRTMLWLMTLIFLPVLGVVLYIFLGPDLKRIKTKRLFRPAVSYPAIEGMESRGMDPGVRKTAALAYRSSSSRICACSEVRLLFDGAETFGAVKKELARARRSIHMEYYIFDDDRLGREIASILCEKASSGVTVRLATDGFGSWKMGRELIRTMQRAGVKYSTFMPISFPFFHSRPNFRNHRKIIVIDGETAFTGGMNIGVEYLGEGPLGHWRDTHVMLRGEGALALDDIFASDWKISAGEPFLSGEPRAPGRGAELSGSAPAVPLQIVPSGGSAWRSIRQMYFMMITSAQKRIWITTPYLIPGEVLAEALRTAAFSGCDVRILIPEKSDHFLSHWAGFSNVEDLLRSGVRIWLYRKGFVHAKTLIMDDAIASVGTANLDSRSLDINLEVQAFIYDGKICRELSERFTDDMRDSAECRLADWEKRPLRSKILESVGRLWSSQV